MNVAGFSLGGAIAVAFAERFPNRVMRLIAMSPAGFLPKKPKAYYLLKCLWCCLVPLAPHVVCTCWYKRERFMKSLKTDEGFEEADADNLWRKFVWQLFVKRGVASATLAVLHRVPWFSLRPLFCRAGSHPRQRCRSGASGGDCHMCEVCLELRLLRLFVSWLCFACDAALVYRCFFL